MRIVYWLLGVLAVACILRTNLADGTYCRLGDDVGLLERAVTRLGEGTGVFYIDNVRDFGVFKTGDAIVPGISNNPIILLPFVDGWVCR